MLTAVNNENRGVPKLFLSTFFLGIITYGFALTNFTVSIDNETPIMSDFGLELGRWGQNLILYHIFGGHLTYFSLLLSLCLFSIAAVQISDLLKFNGFAAYCFCGLFITFPQLSYQLVFGMMTVVSALGVLLSVLSVTLFLTAFEERSLPKKLALFLLISLLLMFILAIYQAFILVPITLFIILFFLSTFEDEFRISTALRKAFFFGAVLLVSGLLYYISVKIICPIPEGGYISSFVSGGSGDFFTNFKNIAKENLKGDFYYGEKLFLLVPVLTLALSLYSVWNKKHFIYRFLALLFLTLSPFTLSYFITNGYHPPRIYLTSNLIFAFVITFALGCFRANSYKLTQMVIVLIVILNIYFVTKLYISVNKVYKYDKRIAEKIDNIIQSKYPEFYSSDKSIYFYGYFPYDFHQNMILDKSEIFGGSMFTWDNGNNYRLVNFFKEADVAEYNMINRDQFSRVKDSIAKMPAWPDAACVKMINKVVIVKLGKEKGQKLYFE